ncbi:MAG: DUF4332 domain-containing protein [Chloroflexota bacterium]
MATFVPFVAGVVTGVVSKWGVDQYLARRKNNADPTIDAPAPKSQEPVVLEDLKRVSGIGPSYSGLLNQAGILNLADLASETPERLHEIVKSVRIDEVADWISQAKELSQAPVKA